MLNHLSVDKNGTLYLNYGYYTEDYREEGLDSAWYYPVLAFSKDKGETWQLVENDFDLIRR